MATMNIALMLVAITCGVLMKSSSALIHVVGGHEGWEIPPNSTFYRDWAKPRTFGLHDKLVFPYRPGAHNVLQVSKEDFDKCGNDNVIAQYYKGPTVIQLTSTGDYYFYSGIGTHCELGQKLHIKVVPGPGSSGRQHSGGRRLSEAESISTAPAPGPTNSGLANAVPLFGLVICSLLVVLVVNFRGFKLT